MPFRAYDTATAALMGDVFDGAWAELKKSGALDGRDPDTARALLASIIIALADQDIRDPQSWSAQAVARFKL